MSHDQARGCIIVASSPEILTRVKKVTITVIKGIVAWVASFTSYSGLTSIHIILLFYWNFISQPSVFYTYMLMYRNYWL